MSKVVVASGDWNSLTQFTVHHYFDDVELESLYHWIDRIPLSRPKKHIGKDFSDGVLVAEIIKHYFPQLVDLHNYTPAVSDKQKMENWYLLNRRVLVHLDIELSDAVIRALSNCKQPVLEKVLMLLRAQIDKFLEQPLQLRRQAVFQLKDSVKPKANELSTNLQPGDTGKQLMSLSSVSGVDPLCHSARWSVSLIPALAPAIDNVSRALLEEKKLECLAQDETIQILNAKLMRLEYLLQLKDLRIEDLECQLRHTEALKMVQSAALQK